MFGPCVHIILLSFKQQLFFVFEADFSQATAAFLVIGFLAIVGAAILILLFGLVEKMRTKNVRLATLGLSATAGIKKSAFDAH